MEILFSLITGLLSHIKWKQWTGILWKYLKVENHLLQRMLNLTCWSKLNTYFNKFKRKLTISFLLFGLSFKMSVKQDLKRRVYSNFQITFLLLVRWTPLQMRLRVSLTFSHSLGQADIWSGVPSIRLWIRLTFGQMYPQDEALGQVDIWSDFRSCFSIAFPICESNSSSQK